uniref:Uncharacterized protein n=1 Tax=Oryza rufipogon TaxID=4529 RepID=A0A0E0MZZ6_ORYRU
MVAVTPTLADTRTGNGMFCQGTRRQDAADALRVEFNFRILLPASGLLNIRSVFQSSSITRRLVPFAPPRPHAASQATAILKWIRLLGAPHHQLQNQVGNKSLRAVERYDENCDVFTNNTPTASNVVHPVVTPNSHPCAENRDASFNTPSNVHMCTGSHEDVSHLSVAELKRKRARDRYAALTPEQKDDRNKKARERRKRKEEETQVSAPLGDISNISAVDIMKCQLEVTDSSPLHQGKSEASHLNITPRRLPFTIINNVAHYGPNEVPMSRFTQRCENQYESSFFEGSDQNECDHDDDISLDFILHDQQNSP